MAVTKIHPIKSTLKKSLDYICNPKKTDEKLLISSFGCAPETADIEFDLTRNLAKIKSNYILARHLMQSFEPGEVTPEKAHEIGQQLADEVLGGRYEYVLTTHIDKGHVHNHIIFNNVDLIEHKRYDSNKKSYHQLRRTSDRICKENGLSVIKNPVAKNISRKEYEERKKGTSWKARLQIAIDSCIKNARSFDGFINLMKETGYEIKQGKYIAFRAPGQERFTRAKTLGDGYTEDAIRKKIDSQRTKKRNTIYRPNVLKVNLFVNLKAHVKAKNKALDHWAKVRNLKEAANTLNFLSAKNITAYSQLNERILQLENDFDITSQTLKKSESKLRDLSEILSDLTKYQKLLPIADKYNKAWNKNKFKDSHESELIIFEAAKKSLIDKNINLDTDIKQLQSMLTLLTEKKDNLYSKYQITRAELNNFKKAQTNVNQILNRSQNREKTIEKER